MLHAQASYFFFDGLENLALTGPPGLHIDFDNDLAGRLEGLGRHFMRVLGVGLLDVFGLQTLAEAVEVRRVQLHLIVTAALDGVLDVLDHALASVVHHDCQHIDLFLHGAGQLANVGHETAVANQGHGLSAQVV